MIWSCCKTFKPKMVCGGINSKFVRDLCQDDEDEESIKFQNNDV